MSLIGMAPSRSLVDERSFLNSADPDMDLPLRFLQMVKAVSLITTQMKDDLTHCWGKIRCVSKLTKPKTGAAAIFSELSIFGRNNCCHILYLL